MAEDKDDFKDLLDDLDEHDTAGRLEVDVPQTDFGSSGDGQFMANAGHSELPEEFERIEDLPDPAPAAPVKIESKVDLDLDGADFLEDEPVKEPESEPASALAQLVPEPPAEESKAEGFVKRLKTRLFNFIKTRRKLALIIGAGFLLVVVMIVLLFIFGPGGKPPEQASPVGEVRSKLSVSAPQARSELIVAWDPMILEYKDPRSGKVHFIIIKLALQMNDSKVKREIDEKNLILRDAVYYYLANDISRDLQQKNDPSVLKPVLIEIVNQYLLSGNIKDIFFEEYLVK